jgi:hypothetical protein
MGSRTSAGFQAVLRVGEFRYLWFAELLSVAGDQLARVALAVLVFTRGLVGWADRADLRADVRAGATRWCVVVGARGPVLAASGAGGHRSGAGWVGRGDGGSGAAVAGVVGRGWGVERGGGPVMNPTVNIGELGKGRDLIVNFR